MVREHKIQFIFWSWFRRILDARKSGLQSLLVLESLVGHARCGASAWAKTRKMKDTRHFLFSAAWRLGRIRSAWSGFDANPLEITSKTNFSTHFTASASWKELDLGRHRRPGQNTQYKKASCLSIIMSTQSVPLFSLIASIKFTTSTSLYPIITHPDPSLHHVQSLQSHTERYKCHHQSHSCHCKASFHHVSFGPTLAKQHGRFAHENELYRQSSSTDYINACWAYVKDESV